MISMDELLFLNNIAHVYSLQEDYDKALDTYDVALDIAENKLDDEGVAYLIKQNIKDMESFKKGMFLQVKNQPTFMNFTNIMEKHWKRINQHIIMKKTSKICPQRFKKN